MLWSCLLSKFQSWGTCYRYIILKVLYDMFFVVAELFPKTFLRPLSFGFVVLPYSVLWQLSQDKLTNWNLTEFPAILITINHWLCENCLTIEQDKTSYPSHPFWENALLKAPFRIWDYDVHHAIELLIKETNFYEERFPE